MPVILVFRVPESINEVGLVNLCEGLKAAVVSVTALGLTPDEVSVFFPTDRLKVGLGEEVIVFVDGVFEKPERTPIVRAELAQVVGNKVKSFFPKAFVEVFVRGFNPVQGYWSSDMTS